MRKTIASNITEILECTERKKFKTFASKFCLGVGGGVVYPSIPPVRMPLVCCMNKLELQALFTKKVCKIYQLVCPIY